jgi:hypothetical protein
MFVIEDEKHADLIGRFASYELAVLELKRLAELPWNEKPNRAPCSSWGKCGRAYEIVEYDDSSSPWKEIHRVAALNVSACGVEWRIAPSR